MLRPRLGVAFPPALVALVVLAAFTGFECQNSDAPPVVMGGHGGGGGGGASDSGTPSDEDSDIGTSGGTLASGVSSPQAIVLGPDTVYWTTARAVSSGGEVGDASAGPGSVESVARSGGSVTEVVAGLTSPVALAVEGTTLFYGQGTGSSGTLDDFRSGTISTSSIAVGQPAPLALFLDVATSTLWWTSGSGASFTVDSIVTGGAGTVGSVTPALSSTTAYQPLAIAVLGSTAYVLATDAGAGVLLSVSAASKTPTELWREASVTPVDLAIAGESLYWTLSNTPSEGGEILSVGIAGGTAATLATALDRPAKLAAVAGTVYFTTNVASGAVMSVSTGGGNLSTLATGLDYPYPIAVDDAVYVGTATTIMRVAK